MKDEALRALPSVDALLQRPDVRALQADYGRPLTLAAARAVLEAARNSILHGQRRPDPSEDSLASAAADWLAAHTAPSLHPVINATGVIIHTNLGRVPLSAAARAAVQAVAQDYNTLEYDLQRGKRGARSEHAADLICQFTGAESALVVNNNASALLLILTAFAKRKGVVISRSQLIEIGGGFRIPDIMKQSGAKLVEVGATNRTHLRDFEQAVADEANRVGLLMRAHHSNFRIVGFTTEPSLDELVAFGRLHDLPVVDDLGSGALLDTAAYGLGHEPTVQESLAAGADIVCFSGDKLLGGPQAGVIVGRADLIRKLARHPLTRAVRPDKLCLAALSATILHYLRDEATEQIPVWRMISMAMDVVEARARALAAALESHAGLEIAVIPGESTVGGGSLPEETLPTRLVAVRAPRPDQFARALRARNVIARIHDERVVFDLRTVLPAADARLADAIAHTADGLPPSAT
ncbi:MAG: L-seryl-tRNA(Sec) selenium transferase [Anaerolineales bacterium]